MVEEVSGSFKGRWGWTLQRGDERAEGDESWKGQINQSSNPNAVGSWLVYEHGASAKGSTATVDAPTHPDLQPEELCAAIWPVVDEYLRDRG